MNKNTRRVKKLIAKAVRQKQSEIVILVPVYNYHNYSNDQVRSGHGIQNRSIPVPLMGDDGVVSRNVRRNTQMKVRHNSGANGTFSLTSHEPINEKAPVVHANHRYISEGRGYEQPAAFRSAAA